MVATGSHLSQTSHQAAVRTRISKELAVGADRLDRGLHRRRLLADLLRLAVPDAGLGTVVERQLSERRLVYTPANGIGRMTGEGEGTTDFAGYWGVERWTPYSEDCIVESWTNEQPGREGPEADICSDHRKPPPTRTARRLRMFTTSTGQDRQPINRVMFVDESFTPATPTGNCTSLPVSQNDANSNSAGIFGPDLYTLDAGAPVGCSSTSTQSFVVRLNGVNNPITTRYRVTWAYNGVTLEEQ
jgi:hypothetical protein